MKVYARFLKDKRKRKRKNKSSNRNRSNRNSQGLKREGRKKK
jgi:hypothetical protein